MAKTPIIIDCDPGQDDAVALFLAFAARDRLDILGVTVVAGNAPLPLTARNARIAAELAGVKDVPIHAGCAQPIAAPLITARHVHGATGIDGIDVFSPSVPLADAHAADFIVETLRASERPITLVPTGPLTNIATALAKAPSIVKNIENIVLMGGAMREGGNITPSAEFNIYVDPHAADRVLKCGAPIVMHGLDVTHKVLCEPNRMNAIKALDNNVANAAHGMLNFFNRHDTEKYGAAGAPLHDPCTIAYLLAPELFKTKSCNVEVETASPLTRGATAVDFWRVTDRPKNVVWAYDVDADGFFDLLTSHLSLYG